MHVFNPYAVERTVLVLNDEGKKTTVFDTVSMVFNKGVKTRYETLDGREYQVVPMVMLTRGVHNGSRGPLLYKDEELGKTPEVWNTKPIVVYHPTKNGVGVSACSPEILEARSVGMIMNAKFDGRLTAEAWLDRKKTKKVDDRILDAIDAGKPMEVSTGFFHEELAEAGDFNGEAYKAVVKNMRPDHLALLPDQKGACSLADGAGLLRNEVSFDQVRDLLTTALKKEHGETYCYVADVFRNFFIYYKGGETYKQKYSATDTQATLVGDPEKVVRVNQYRTLDGSVINKEGDDVNKVQLIAFLVANSAGLWTETDRAFLEKQDEKKLQVLVDHIKQTPTGNEKKPEDKPTATPPPAAPTSNTEPAKKPQTVDEFVANAPPEFREMILTGLSAHRAERTKLAGVILANSRNVFTKEQLAAMPLDQLQGLAALAATPQQPAASASALFSGLGDIPTGNKQTAVTETPLALPSTAPVRTK